VRKVFFLWSVGLALILSGCATDSIGNNSADSACDEQSKLGEFSQEAAVIVMPGSNFTDATTAFNSSKQSLAEALKDTSTKLKVYVSSGDTRLVSERTLDLAAGLETIQSSRLKKIGGEIERDFSCSRVLDNMLPEMDILSALNMAAQTSNGAPVTHIFVVSNGIQTSGDLRLQDGFGGDPTTVVENLVTNNALPLLKGVRVHWLGIGQTTGDQPPFSVASTNALKDLWTEIVEKSGGTVTFEGAIKLGQGNPDGPSVAQVAPLFVPPVVQSCRSVLTDENLSFVANTANFLSPSLASETFDNLKVQFGAQNCTGTLRITGFTTNFGSESSQKSIAQSRAEAVAAELAKRFPGLKSEVQGIGYDGTGGLDQSNRRVEVSFSN